MIFERRLINFFCLEQDWNAGRFFIGGSFALGGRERWKLENFFLSYFFFDFLLLVINEEVFLLSSNAYFSFKFPRRLHINFIVYNHIGLIFPYSLLLSASFLYIFMLLLRFCSVPQHQIAPTTSIIFSKVHLVLASLL